MLRDTRNSSTRFGLFGTGGDLSMRRMTPVLFYIYLSKQLPQRLLLWGIGQKQWQTMDFIENFRRGVTSSSIELVTAHPRCIG